MKNIHFFILLLIGFVNLNGQSKKKDYLDFTIRDCYETPCQDLIVEGVDEGVTFKYVDCKCLIISVYVPKGKAFVVRGLIGTIEVDQGTFITSG